MRERGRDSEPNCKIKKKKKKKERENKCKIVSRSSEEIRHKIPGDPI